jgi:hypothetical protein
MEKEKIYLTTEELEDFDFTGGSQWKLRNEIYKFVEEIRTDKYSDGPSWDIVVQRKSDKKYFKWNCWNPCERYYMESGDNYMEEVFPEKTVITKWK